MPKKIFIIDDSAFMRRVISDIIKKRYPYAVIRVAKDGIEGMQLIEEELPDIMILDINMPRMDGIQLLEQLQQRKIYLPTIVASTVAKNGTYETIKALELGAFDFIAKPSNIFDVKSIQYAEQLISKINLAMDTKHRLTHKGKININGTTHSKLKNKIIALGCSTGGPKALHKIITKLPKNLASSILIVQHMPAGFTKSLATRLNEISAISVKEAEHLEIVKKGTVYIAKGGYHMRVETNSSNQEVIKLTNDAPKNGHRPSVNALLESLISTNYDEIISIILTGMGSDGTEGLKALKVHKKTYVMAQDELSCVVYGMPKSVVENDLADEVIPLEDFPKAIINKVGVH